MTRLTFIFHIVNHDIIKRPDPIIINKKSDTLRITGIKKEANKLSLIHENI